MFQAKIAKGLRLLFGKTGSDWHYFTFFMQIACFLSDNQKKKTETRFNSCLRFCQRIGERLELHHHLDRKMVGKGFRSGRKDLGGDDFHRGGVLVDEDVVDALGGICGGVGVIRS